jgi:hypothetical protein
MKEQLLLHVGATNSTCQIGQPDDIKRAAQRFERCAAPCLASRFFWAKLWFQRFVNLFPDVLENCVAEATLLPDLATLAVEEVVLWYPA